MGKYNSVSKVEWLCAAFIDLMLLGLISGCISILRLLDFYTYKSIISASFAMYETNEYFTNIITVVSFIYFITKDLYFKNRSLGKKIMGIAIEKDGQPLSPATLIIRNLPLALFFAHLFLGFIGIKNLFVGNLFITYFVADMLCVNYTGKTIGDHICKSDLVKVDSEQVILSDKYSNHFLLIVICMILYHFIQSMFYPCLYIYDAKPYDIEKFAEAARDSAIFNCISVSLAYVVGYSFFIYKLSGPKSEAENKMLFYIIAIIIAFPLLTISVQYLSTLSPLKYRSLYSELFSLVWSLLSFAFIGVIVKRMIVFSELRTLIYAIIAFSVIQQLLKLGTLIYAYFQ
ncbi:MAG: RDD family protein [Paludibacteraceae bacterium]|nr:RDD family protein [Paludibacteraceae bacterium]